MSEDRLAHVKSRLDTINSILDKLWTIATADEDVTEDEQAIIISVKANIDSYRKVANKLAREEDISDPDLARLHSFEKKIVQDASAKALLDGHISGEESDLLQSLLSFFEDLNE